MVEHQQLVPEFSYSWSCRYYNNWELDCSHANDSSIFTSFVNANHKPSVDEKATRKNSVRATTVKSENIGRLYNRKTQPMGGTIVNAQMV